MTENLVISRKFTFDYGHHLPYYVGNCKNPHGHTATLIVEVAGPVNRDEMSNNGMILDFRIFKTLVWKVLGKLDHKNLNDVEGLDNPTTENIILFIKEKLTDVFKEYNKDLTLHSLILSEGKGKYISWYRYNNDSSKKEDNKEVIKEKEIWDMQVKRQEEIINRVNNNKDSINLKDIAAEIIIEASELYDACRNKWWNTYKNEKKTKEARIHESIDILRLLIAYWTKENIGMEEVYERLKNRIVIGEKGELGK